MYSSQSAHTLQGGRLTPTYPPEQVTLRDGTAVTLRPIRPDDAPRLQAAVARLLPQSIYLRFLIPLRRLSDADAQRLAMVDYDRRMALVAVIEVDGEEHIIGVARYAMTETDGVAEPAIVVGDTYQGRGLGTILLALLARYARAHGVHAFAATIAAENTRILRVVEHTGLPFKVHDLGHGERELRIDLSDVTPAAPAN